MKIYKTISNSKNNAHHNGASLVEFAVVCILFFILLFSIIDFAILLYNKQVINNAAREGARYGLVARPLDSPISVNSIENEEITVCDTFSMSNASLRRFENIDEALTYTDQLGACATVITLEDSIACFASVVKLSLFSLTPRSTRSLRPGSNIGSLPFLRFEIFSLSISRHMTLLPRLARHVPVVKPT